MRPLDILLVADALAHNSRGSIVNYKYYDDFTSFF